MSRRRRRSDFGAVKKKKKRLEERGSCSCCGSALQSASRERRKARCATSLSRAMCVRALPRALLWIERGKAKEKENELDFCRFRCFAFLRFVRLGTLLHSLLLLIAFFLFCSLPLLLPRALSETERELDPFPLSSSQRFVAPVPCSLCTREAESRPLLRRLRKEEGTRPIAPPRSLWPFARNRSDLQSPTLQPACASSACWRR